MAAKFFNTLSAHKDTFTPTEQGKVKMYHCGPTVYGKQHIGNLSMFVFTDVLRRTLEQNGFTTEQVINFTDFGHLTGDNLGDADQGEDRMTKGLKAEGLEISMENMKVLAHKYAEIFLEDIKKLNVKTDETKFPYASEYIEAQIKLIETLFEKGFAYEGSKAVYFNTSKFPTYGELGKQNIEGQKEGARVQAEEEKKNPTDFVLWKKDSMYGWQSPWGLGFPGWHIECSAMIIELLGEQIDIHTGGIEHIGVHHNNEIAQSEAATGKSPFSNFWMHRAHLKINGEKISKSLGNTVYISDLLDRGIHPLALRYLLLGAHYRSPSNFTWEAVESAQTTLERIVLTFANAPESNSSATESSVNDRESDLWTKFLEAINDDLNTPVALSVLQKTGSKDLIEKMDEILGLNIKTLAEDIKKVPDHVLELKDERDRARTEKNWARSDELRTEIERLGFILEDKGDSTTIRKSLSQLAREIEK